VFDDSLLGDARALAEAYRSRWRLENVFQTLTEALVCEINTLAYPKAALFGFCVALVTYNVLATVRAALRSEHGREAVEAQEHPSAADPMGPPRGGP